MRAHLIEHGAQFLFDTKVVDIIVEKHSDTSVEANSTDELSVTKTGFPDTTAHSTPRRNLASRESIDGNRDNDISTAIKITGVRLENNTVIEVIWNCFHSSEY